MLPVPGEESSSQASSTSESMAKGTIISHIHKLIEISLRPSSHDPLLLSLPPSKSNSEELPNRTLKTPHLDEDDSDSSTSSANFMADNEDLLIQILVFLPLKSLVRFQSVSKQWLSIISDPSFRRLRLRVHPGAHFLYRRGMDKSSELNFISYCEAYVNPMGDTVSHLRNFFDVSRILGFHSCNGLVAIALNSNTGGYLEFFVFNPATHHHRLIPPLHVQDNYNLGEYYDYDPHTYQLELVEPMICSQTRHQYCV